MAQAARALVGTRFVLHGRDPACGLDCIGLVEVTLGRCGHAVRLPNRYTLRGDHAGLIGEAAGALTTLIEMTDRQGSIAPGDILALRPGPALLHFAIASGRGCAIHAHAGLRRIVESRLPPEWPCIARWRVAQPGAERT